MDDLAFAFGKMYERFNKSVPKLAAFLKLEACEEFTTSFINKSFDRLILLADEEIANAGAVHTPGSEVKP